MLCRRLILSIARKRLFYAGLQASNIASFNLDKLNNNSNTWSNSINVKEIENFQHNLKIIKRFKSNKRQSKQQKNEESDDENEDDDDDDYDIEARDKSSPVASLKVSSLRVDLVLKAALNIARNKVETAFYESNIRINGQKVLKKSEQVRIGDEIDIVRGISPTNPDFLIVSRVHLLNAKESGDNISIKFTRNKALVIENYEEAWKSSSSDT